jgi:hypothetical protein
MQPSAGTSAGPTASLHWFEYARGWDLGWSSWWQEQPATLHLALLLNEVRKRPSDRIVSVAWGKASSVDGQADTERYQ